MSKILIVDDVDVNRLLLNELLSDFNIDILEADNGKECINIFINNSDISLIFMDIQMPLMNGIEATKYIRENLNKDIPIIAVTAYSTSEFRDISIFNDILLKPLNKKMISDTIKKYLM
jgi:CheY-like chemotaxis protein